jgi:hypothetical protein
MKMRDFDMNDEDSYSSPKDRIPMIKEIFQLVLNREPSSRELSFYKYGIQSKEEIIDKLLNEDEHKKALERSKEFPDMEDRAKLAENKVTQLKQKIEDSAQEETYLRNLLDEKNREIAILRKEKEDPYNFTHSQALRYIRSLTENGRENGNNSSSNTQTVVSEDKHFSSISGYPETKKESFIDKIYKIIKF